MRFKFRSIFLILTLGCVPAMGFAKEVHFVIVDSGLNLLSSNPQDLKDECTKLQAYVEFYSKRNQRVFRTDPSRCANPQAFDFKLMQNQIRIPDYSRSDETHKRIQKMSEGPSFSLSLSSWFPKEIWTRYQDIPQDGVCYNTALVESGILSESERSSFITTTEYFLGMQGLQKAKPQGSEVLMSYGPRSDSPLISSRKTWEIGSGNRDLLRQGIQQHLVDHFSPGSILCISIDRLENKNTLPEVLSSIQSELPHMKFRTNIQSLPEDYLTERQGGHCLVFLTPDLISESNQLLPKNLVNWNIAFDYYFDLVGRMTGEGRFHYFQINLSEALSSRWIQKQIESSNRIQRLFDLAKRHRELYESLPWSPCRGSGGQINFYSDTCTSTNPEAQLKLKNFWNEADLLIFNHPDFADFQTRLRTQSAAGFESNIDNAAFEIFSNMWQVRTRF